ncbi:MAG: S41 family peptidase [Myxococcota bacterium]
MTPFLRQPQRQGGCWVAAKRWVSLFLFALLFTHVGLQQPSWTKNPTKPADCFSCLRSFNAVLLQLYDRYVDPNKFDPQQMLLQALLAMERQVVPVMVQQQNSMVTLQVGTTKKQFDISWVASIWDVAWSLRSMVQFVDQHLPAQSDRGKAQQALANGLLSTLDDYCILLDPKQAADLNTRTKGEFGGLGIYIGFRDGILTVISPIEGTPAERADVQALDQIVKINDDSTINLSLDESAQRLRGKPGTTVTIQIKRKGQPKLLSKTIERAVIEIESVKYELLADNVGYIRIKAYDGKTSEKVRYALQTFRSDTNNQLKAAILDLRGNPGGLLSEAIRVVSPFLPQHELVVITQGSQPQDRREERVQTGPHDMQLPLAVLIDGGSASASEIDAGALKDHARAIIMGSEATFGKASVQLLHPLPDRSILKYTIARYQTPLGKNIDGVGIAPDVLLKPVFVDDKNSLQLFRSRLDDQKQQDNALCTQREAAPIEVTYVQKRQQKRDPKKDYQVQFARRVLVKAQGNANRAHLIDVAQQEAYEARQQQTKQLAAALKNFGIDWSSGQNSQLKVRLQQPLYRIKAGQKANIDIEAHNVGKDPIWQLHGVSSAFAEVFSGHEFIIGKLLPKAKRSWSSSFEVPISSLGYHDVIEIPFYNGSNKQLAKLNIPVEVRGLPRSRLASRFYINNAQGTSDGQLHPQETTHLVMWLKNVGKGSCKRPVVWLKDSGKSNLFVDKGRYVLDPLKPGEEAAVEFVFRLKEPAKAVDLKVQAYDETLGNGWTRQLHFDVATAQQPLTNLQQQQFARVATNTTLWPTLQHNSTALAQLKKGQLLRVQAGGDNLSKVLVRDHLAGFVANRDITLLPKGSKQSAVFNKAKETEKATTGIAYYVPAKFVFPGGAPNTLTTVAQYSLRFSVHSTPFLQDVVVFVDDKKQFFQSVAQKGPLQLPIEQTLQLKPGLNWITLVARHDTTDLQRQRFAVYVDDKNLFKRPPSPAKKAATQTAP